MTQSVTACMLTGLPIYPGETCVGFLISKRNRPAPEAGPHEKFWHSLTPAMWGTYDGFGNFVGIRAPAGTTRVMVNAEVSVNLPDGTFLKMQESNPMLNLVAAAAVENTAVCKCNDEALALVLIKAEAYQAAIESIETSPYAPALAPTPEILDSFRPSVRNAIKANALSFDDARELREFELFLSRAGRAWFPSGVYDSEAIDGQLILNLTRATYHSAMAAFAGENKKG